MDFEKISSSGKVDDADFIRTYEFGDSLPHKKNSEFRYRIFAAGAEDLLITL